jgi:hypothetical protein
MTIKSNMPLMWEKKKIAGIPNLVKTLKDTTYEETQDDYQYGYYQKSSSQHTEYFVCY